MKRGLSAVSVLLGVMIAGCTNPGARLPGQGPIPSEAPRQSFSSIDVSVEDVKPSGLVGSLLGLKNSDEAQIGIRSKFSPAAYGVKSSPRVSTKKKLRKGGGRYQVGKPYTIRGRRYVPREDPNYTAVGLGSWYGPNFHGRLTANGEIYDQYSLSAAHPTMPLPSYARVTNVSNGKSVIVRVNDRGPFSKGRIIDLSARAAQLLDYEHRGVAKVKVDYVGKARMDGKDGDYLLASYQPGKNEPSRVQLASNSRPVRRQATVRTVNANLPDVSRNGLAETNISAAPKPASTIEDRMGIPRPVQGLNSYMPDLEKADAANLAISSMVRPLMTPRQGMEDLARISFGPFIASHDLKRAQEVLGNEGLVVAAHGENRLLLTIAREDAADALERLAAKGLMPSH